jgi:signal transduction histidine kinase
VISGAWLVLVFLVESVRFVIFDPQAKTGFEVFVAIGQIFGAFVLAIAPVQAARGRLRWVAAGLLVFGLGTIGYGYVYPLLVESPTVAASMYGSIYVRTVGTVLCAIGLAAPRVPSISVRALTCLAAVIAFIGTLLVLLSDHLPALIHVSGNSSVARLESMPAGQGPRGPLQLADLEAVLSTAGAVFPGLTAWHFGLAMLPLVASAVAAWGATRRASSTGGIRLWLVLALTLLVSAQLHAVFWPSIYSSVLSTTTILRLTVATVVVGGGVLELRTIISQRDTLLMAEHEHVQRLEDLAQLKADFTSIVAHELATPIAAIKAMSQMMAIDDLPVEMRRRTAEEIEEEARLLEMLVQDIRETANLERDDFRITPRRISVDRLVAEAVAYARSLPGAHPVSIEQTTATSVWGDPDRLGQVMRNLLNNAARYTPDGTPIMIRTRRDQGEVVIEVADRGPGVPPEDIERIFEKFGRGRAAAQSHAGGRGLGLYLSRRIMRSHQSDLVVESESGQGTSFSFRLKELP